MQICISKYRQHNGQKKKDKQHTHKTAKRVTRTPLKSGGEITCSGRVGSSCSARGTRRVNLVEKVEHIRGKKKCLSYQEFQNKEEFEDTQGVINNTYVKYNMSYLRYFCLFM
jgi:hypothetical protein